MTPCIIHVPLPDGSFTKFSVFQKENLGTDVVILFPAMGVAASYYESFAKALADKNIIAITADLRGLGLSSVRPSPKSDFGFHEMLELDYKGIIGKVNSLFPGSRKFIMGHSLGGILGSLYISKYPNEVDGLILTASVNVYYKGWSGFDKWKTLLGTQAFAGIASLLGYFPGHRIGFGGKGAARAIKDWSFTARTGNYKVIGDGFDFEKNLSNVVKPVLAISFEKDDLAPQKAVENLLGKFSSSTPITRFHLHSIKENGKPYSHYNWVKNSTEAVQLMEDWLKKK